MGRRELREHIFKLLFISQFHQAPEMPEQFALYLEELEGLLEKDGTYIRDKCENVIERLEDIDGVISETSKGWKTNRMNRADLTLLRLAVYEMFYDEDVPVKVAINEAVELAKRFGGEESPSFINGILGKIAEKSHA